MFWILGSLLVSLNIIVWEKIFTHCNILGSEKFKLKEYFIGLYSVQFNLHKSI